MRRWRWRWRWRVGFYGTSRRGGCGGCWFGLAIILLGTLVGGGNCGRSNLGATFWVSGRWCLEGN